MFCKLLNFKTLTTNNGMGFKNMSKIDLEVNNHRYNRRGRTFIILDRKELRQ